jgi:hypothetical protein
MEQRHQFCGRCGRILRPAARFCGNCGHPVRQPGQQPASASTKPPPAAVQARRSAVRWPFIVVLAVFVLGGGAVVAILALRSPRPPAPQANVAAVSTGDTATTTQSSEPPSPTGEEQAAQALSTLLAQSATDRGSIVQAVADVTNCGPNLSQDAQVFQEAAASRQNLLTELTNLSGQSTLPPELLQALTGAWQASAQADQDFASWAQDEASQGCTTNDQFDINYQSAAGPDDQATADKKEFVGLWNPIAAQYGLTAYQWEQL